MYFSIIYLGKIVKAFFTYFQVFTDQLFINLVKRFEMLQNCFIKVDVMKVIYKPFY